MTLGKKIMSKKEKRRSNIIFPIILRVLGRISSGKRGRDRNFGEDQDLKNEGGFKEYQVV